MQEQNILTDYDKIISQNAMPARAAIKTDHQTHYIFNPFGEKFLSTLYVRFYGMPSIPAGYIIPIREFTILDVNCQIVGMLSNEAMSSPLEAQVPELKEFVREPGKIVRDMLRNYGTFDTMPTGLCEIEPLRNCDDMALARDIQGFCLPERFQTVDMAIAHLRKAIEEAAGMPVVFGQVAEALLLSHSQNRTFGRKEYQKLIADLERHKETAIGKSEPSEYDKELCAWLGLPEPRISGFMPNETPQQPQTIILQAPAAPSAGEDGERTPCPNCFEPIRVMDGKIAPYCRFCQQPTSPQQVSRPVVEVDTVRENRPNQQGKR